MSRRAASRTPRSERFALLALLAFIGASAACSGESSSAPSDATSSATASTVIDSRPAPATTATPPSNSTSGAPTTPPPTQPVPVQNIDGEFLAAAVDDMIVSDGAVLIAVVDRDGEVVHATVGTDDDGAVPEVGDAFRVGSITKVFTALATLMLVDDGTLDIDAPAADYVSRLPIPADVTVRNLLQHRSGIFNVTDEPDLFANVFEVPERAWTPEEQMALIADRPSLFDPGSQFRYSNSNFVILGVLIEEVTGRRYDEVVRERVIDPLGLTSTYVDGFEDGPAPFDPYEGSIPSDRDPSYDYTSIATVAWSAGAIVSSAEDLHRLFTALFDERVISADSLQQMTTGDEYGLGVDLSDWSRGLIGHGGGIPGYATFVRHSVDSGATAFFASTALAADPSQAIRAVLDALAGDGR